MNYVSSIAFIVKNAAKISVTCLEELLSCRDNKVTCDPSGVVLLVGFERINSSWSVWMFAVTVFRLSKLNLRVGCRKRNCKLFASALFWHLQKTDIYKNFRPSRVHFPCESLPAIFHSHGVTYIQKKTELKPHSFLRELQTFTGLELEDEFQDQQCYVADQHMKNRDANNAKDREDLLWDDSKIQMLLLRCLHYPIKANLCKEWNKPSSRLFLAWLRWYSLIAMT